MLSLTPSHIIQHLYCPRFTYFEYVLRIPQYEEKYFKVQKGRAVHQQKAQQNIAYLRQSLGVIDKQLNQYLTNDLLRGEVDEILWLKDGTMAPLDYKFAPYKDRVFTTYKTQLYCYAWLIAAQFERKVKKGFLVYTRSQNKVIEVPITSTHIATVQGAAERIGEIISQNSFPNATHFKKRCLSCTYRNICSK